MIDNGMSRDERLLRELLWLRHDAAHSSILYGDDGEMQCSACRIDFKRDAPSTIKERWQRMGFESLTLQETALVVNGQKIVVAEPILSEIDFSRGK